MDSKARIIHLRKTYPTYSLQRIGDNVGLTRERVRQILKKEGLITSAERRKFECLYCGRSTKYNHKFCSGRDCRYLYNRVKVSCAWCNKVRYVLKSIYNSRLKDSHYKGNFFCNKQCFGYWASSNFGFAVHKKFRGETSYYVRLSALVGLPVEVLREDPIDRTIKLGASCSLYCKNEHLMTKDNTYLTPARRYRRCLRCRRVKPLKNESELFVSRSCYSCGVDLLLRKNNALANEKRHNSLRHFCKECRRQRKHLRRFYEDSERLHTLACKT